MRWDKNGKPYTINFHFGQRNLHEIVNDLARQVVHKNMDDFNSSNPRVKKHPFWDVQFNLTVIKSALILFIPITITLKCGNSSLSA